jgi:hypothetical protein
MGTLTVGWQIGNVLSVGGQSAGLLGTIGRYRFARTAPCFGVDGAESVERLGSPRSKGVACEADSGHVGS